MSSVPHSIGVIMDGNRRWARSQGLSTLEGHRQGLKKTEELLEWAHASGIKEVTLYAFSTENWSRTPEEVAYLMDLFREAFKKLLPKVQERNGRMRFIGQRERMPVDLQELMASMEEQTEQGTKGTLVIALSYGGRAEILSAVNKVLVAGREQVTEEELRDAMWSSGLADPDLIIRTGGEKRLSNFLAWQSVYSELFFLDTPFPALAREEFDMVLADYASRERRHGA